jgi:1,2-diacylglycerol 3-beta-glucosyltransferase
VDRTMIALEMPFSGLPGWAETLFYAVFVLIVLIWLWTLALFLLARRALRSAPTPDGETRDAFLWVFLVPALNEEITIADSVSRLLAVEARNKAILVVDDGSTDGTTAVLDTFETPELEVLHRVAPMARQGKHAALNEGWRHLDRMLTSGRLSGWPRDQVIICVVDADGRLDPNSPRFAASHFTRADVGGLQVLVRIYNRSRVLTWCQDVEFSIFGLLYQAGRTPYGVTAMGGNGQFNRLSALDEIVDDEVGGPWRARLTEDQDLGLHLLEAGWRNVADARTSVAQQGLPGFRRLLRQRTRWAQGNLQAMKHIRTIAGVRRPIPVRLDQVCYLLQPAFQALVGIAFVASIFLAIFDVADYWADGGWWQLLFFFLLGYGGILLGCLARGARTGVRGILLGLLIVPVYAAYSWLLWPALARAAARQVTRRRAWSKTAREQIGHPTP